MPSAAQPPVDETPGQPKVGMPRATEPLSIVTEVEKLGGALIQWATTAGLIAPAGVLRSEAATHLADAGRSLLTAGRELVAAAHAVVPTVRQPGHGEF